MDGADVCRTSRRPPDVISTVAILDPRWRGRKWRHPGPGARFSIPIAEAEENGGPSASGRHLGWPHLREPEMRSSKMSTGSGRAAIFLRLRNRDRKTRPILLVDFNSLRTWSPVCDVIDILVNPVMLMMQITVKLITYSWRWYLVEILQMGTCVFRPVCSLAPITPMVGFRFVMPAYHRQRMHKFVSWSSLLWLFPVRF